MARQTIHKIGGCVFVKNKNDCVHYVIFDEGDEPKLFWGCEIKKLLDYDEVRRKFKIVYKHVSTKPDRNYFQRPFYYTTYDETRQILAQKMYIKHSLKNSYNKFKPTHGVHHIDYF